MTELWQWNAPRLSKAYAAHETSPVEVARALLARIATLGKKTNAFCLIDESTTLEQARAAEARWTENAPLSPLDGVPVAIKDLFLTRGWPTFRRSPALPAIPGIWKRHRAVRPVARRRPWRRGWCPWRWAPTAAARSASPPASPVSSASSLSSGALRHGRHRRSA